MKYFLRRTFLLALLFTSAVLARAGVSYDESAAFAFDTRDYLAGLAAESATFVFDTRAVDGLSGSAGSNLFSFDTRSVVASGLTINGPASVPVGGQAGYQITMTGANGVPVDVTAAATLRFSGATPSYAGIGGAMLFVDRAAPSGATIFLKASYLNGAGRVESPTVAVSVAGTLRASLVTAAQNTGGTDYLVTLDGAIAGGAPLYTFRWDTNGDGTYGEVTGQHANFAVSSTGGTPRIGLEVTDGTGAKAYASGAVVLNKPATTNEPQWVNPIGDVGAGTVLGADGQAFQFDQNKVVNGFILLTHGLYSGGTETWLTHPNVTNPNDGDGMVQRIVARLTADRQGRVPNIAIYDWHEDSDPGGKVDPVKLQLLSILGGLQPNPILAHADDIAIVSDRLIDCIYVRPIAQSHGINLAVWIWTQAKNNLIDTNQPVHLVGHSAGGFTIGECALWLKQHPLPNGKMVIVDRVSMLDTPFPIRSHLTTLATGSAPPVVERIVSSFYGKREFPATWFVSPGSFYQLKLMAGYGLRFGFDETGHGLSHRWYNRTIKPLPADDADPDFANGATLDGYGTDGFNLSPFLGGYMASRAGNPFVGHAVVAAALTGDQALSGFGIFGNVVLQNGVYTLTEQANAGLVLHNFTMPIGVRTLKFRYMFTAPGDGDFISVRFGDGSDLYIGPDNELSRAGFTNIEVPLDGLDGKTGDLVITLVSRGTANAVAQAADFALSVDDDADGDGLTNAQEAALGTDPLRYDTDGDGLSDAEEANTDHTNPLLPDSDGDGVWDAAEVAAGTNPNDPNSVFIVTTAQRNADGSFTLSWAAHAGRTYRVLRAAEPAFANYTVVAAGIAGVPPVTTFTDTSLPGGTSRMFYRVEVEQ